MVLDELFAWNIVADPSWRHALYAWNHGVDGGGFLFYASLWPIVRAAHGGILLPRLVATTAWFLAALTWWRTLSRFLPSRWAAIAVVLVFTSTELLLGYIALLRFYGLYLLFTALAIYLPLRAAEGSTSKPTAALLIFLNDACLVLTHIMGSIYVGLVLGAWLLCVRSRKRLWWLSLPMVASWSVMLLCHEAIHNSSLNYGSPGMPRPRDILRYHLKFASFWPVTLLAGIGLFFAFRDLWRKLRSDPDTSRVEVLAPVLCLVYLLSPLTLYVLSVLIKPLATARYLLPYFFSLATLCAYALDRIASRLRTTQTATTQRLAAALLAVSIVALHLRAIRHLSPPASFDVAALRATAIGRPVVVQDEESFFELQHYFSGQGLQFDYLLTPATAGRSGLMGEVAKQGYYPGHLFPADLFERRTPDFLILTSAHHERISWFPTNRTCNLQFLRTIAVDGYPEQLLEAQNCRP